MSEEEVKVYIECYGGLWEVVDPSFNDDGSVDADRFRLVGDDAYSEASGTFTNPVVYEDMAGFLKRALARALDDDGEDEDCTCDRERGEGCTDCPEEIQPVEVDCFDVEFVGATAVAIQVLLDIAQSESVSPARRIEAAEKVIGTHFAVLRS